MNVRSLLERSVTDFPATDLDHLADMIKRRLKVIQHHPEVIDGCLPPTALTHQPWLATDVLPTGRSPGLDPAEGIRSLLNHSLTDFPAPTGLTCTPSITS
ncbi:hypothetical protein ACQEU3_39250 [Spirillospora sp. CA-253888]